MTVKMMNKEKVIELSNRLNWEVHYDEVTAKTFVILAEDGRALIDIDDAGSCIFDHVDKSYKALHFGKRYLSDARSIVKTLNKVNPGFGASVPTQN